MKELFKQKVFTTTEATREGISRAKLRRDRNVIQLGAFPVSQVNGVRRENIWTYDPELANLIKQSKKMVKKSGDAKELVDRIEQIIREKLGFNTEVNDGNQEDN